MMALANILNHFTLNYQQTRIPGVCPSWPLGEGRPHKPRMPFLVFSLQRASGAFSCSGVETWCRDVLYVHDD
jgi:hypothetical protein